MSNFNKKINGLFDDICCVISGDEKYKKVIHDINSVRGLSIRYPYCNFIIDGLVHKHSGLRLYKNIENRSRKTNYRGPLFIQVSGTYGYNEYSKTRVYLKSYYSENIRRSGYIIGIVDLVDCVSPENVPNYIKNSMWYEKGKYAWILENPKKIAPTKHRGSLFLFKIKQNIEIFESQLNKFYNNYKEEV